MAAHDHSLGPVLPPVKIEHADVVLVQRHSNTTVTDKIAGVVLWSPTPKQWFVIIAIAFMVLQLLPFSLGNLVVQGIGLWGINSPVGWGFDIINFVWWIGIGHAGTLISAVLLLFRQEWRMAIARFAEAMTIFAVMCAGLYPVFHTGRPWLAYWLLPYPNTMALWPQPRSPLVWDVFAVSTYATVSILFWYVGLIPDLATMRDRAKGFGKYIYGFLALGWRGSAKHWHRYETASLLLAGLSTPLVLSVHSIVSFDFATGLIPGWHTTVFPPYFVAGAVFAGFAMVLTLAIPVRKWYGLEDFITDRHLENMAKVMFATGMIVCYGYFLEVFMAWYSGNEYEWAMLMNRVKGPYAAMYWALWICNGLSIQILWFKWARRSTTVLFIVSQFVSVGMWLERFVIIPMSIHRDFIPASWGMYYPTVFDWGTFIGSMGFFTFLMFLFIRGLPMISMFEIRTLVKRPAEANH
ncbi:MAG: hydrogenase [Acidobacteria bacterium]|nr:hydrogenase [Acidobacteriota bacterium]